MMKFVNPNNSRVLMPDLSIVDASTLTAEQLATVLAADPIPYTQLRQYPAANIYLDGVVKSASTDPFVKAEGQAQVAKYLADCLAVKAKYPKV